jgi:hypothetical protein
MNCDQLQWAYLQTFHFRQLRPAIVLAAAKRGELPFRPTTVRV